MKQQYKKIIFSIFLFLILTSTTGFITYRNENGLDNANVYNAKTPINTASGGSIWHKCFHDDNDTYLTPCNSDTIIYGDSLLVINKNQLFDLNKYTGAENRIFKLSTIMNSSCHPLLHDEKLYIPLSDGIVECVDINKWEKVFESQSFGGQSLSTLTFKENKLYGGIVSSPGSTSSSGLLYCLDATDGSTLWTYNDEENPTGYYWSGPLVTETGLIFVGDNGILVSHHATSQKIYDQVQLYEKDDAAGTKACIRSSITYNKENNSYYCVSKLGTLFKFSLNEDGSFGKIDSCKINDNCLNCTSTPSIYNNRLYIGYLASQNDQKMGYGFISVIDAEKMELIYTSMGPSLAEVKSSPAISNYYANDESEKVYIYFTANAEPGGIYMMEDSPTSTASSWQKLFMPAQAKQYCMSGVNIDSNGTLYYSNDSGTLFAINEVNQSSDYVDNSTKISSNSSNQINNKSQTNYKSQTNKSTNPDTSSSTKKIKIKKPKKLKVKITKKKKKYKKIKLTWKKAKKSYKTIIYRKYKKGKWKKIKNTKKTSLILKVKNKKIKFKIRCSQKISKKTYYSSFLTSKWK